MKRVEDKQDVPDQDTQLPETLDPKPASNLYLQYLNLSCELSVSKIGASSLSNSVCAAADTYDFFQDLSKLFPNKIN